MARKPAAPPVANTAAPSTALVDLLFAQGFGTRRLCDGLVRSGRVEVEAAFLKPFEDLSHNQRPRAASEFIAIMEPSASVNTRGAAGAQVPRIRVQGLEWHCHATAYVLMHKPAGFECSQKPSAWPSVLSLLPAPLRQRPNRLSALGVQPVGRLDQDTTGLLLLSDDGAFIHRMASPKHHLPKVYEVTCKHPVSDAQLTQLLAGVDLKEEGRRTERVQAAACERLAGTEAAPHRLALTLTEGKYHQVKRMLAAVGNRVESLHRSRMGGLALPADLPPGQWRWLAPQDLAALGWPPS